MVIPNEVKSGIPTRHRAFNPAFLEAWTLFQFRGWLVRKTTLEKGGRSHKDVGAFAKLPEATRVFVRNFAPGLLDIFRFKGRAVVQEMREAGMRMDSVGLAAPCGDLEHPLEGIPLADGTTIEFERELLLDLAFSRHEHWMAVREHSWLSPYEALHQDRRHKAHKAFCRSTPGATWDADIVSVYGDCYALAHLSDEAFQTLLDATPESALPLKVYGEALSERFRSAWAMHFVDFADGWRWRARGLVPPCTKSEIEDRLFALDRAEAILDCLRLYGVDVLEQLRDVGSQLLRIGATERSLKDFDPIVGVSLLDGSTASIDSTLLDDLADEHRLIYERLLAGYAEYPFRRVRELAQRHSAPSLNRDKTRLYGVALSLAALTLGTLPVDLWHELCSAAM